MLERCRRSQSRFEPIGAVPTTRTTRTRRTRRLCVNIEANGGGPLRSRISRRSALPDPYFMTYPPVYEANPWMCGDWGPNEQFYSYVNFVNPGNRLYAGGENECAPVNGFIPPAYESSQEFYGNRNSGQKAAGDLRNILAALDCYLQEDSKIEPGSYVEPDSTGVSNDTQSSQNNQLSAVLDLIYDTVGRLNNYMTAKSNNHEEMNVTMRPLPQPIQVLQLPVQPLILPPMAITNSNLYPSNNSYGMEAEPRPTRSRTHFDRLPWLKERKRKRPPRTISHVLLHSQSCSTDDLDRLPRILEASSSLESRVPMKFFSPPMRDSSTTMWSPMKCFCPANSQEQEKPYKDLQISSPMTKTGQMHCNSSVSIQEQEKAFEDFNMPSPMTIRSPMKYSSPVSTQEQEKPIEGYRIPSPKTIESKTKCGLLSRLKPGKPLEDIKIPSSMSIRDTFPPSSLKAPPPSMKSEDDMDKDHELDKNHEMDRNHEMDIDHEMSESNNSVGASPQTSSYGSSCDYHRNVESNLLYSYVEEEREEPVHFDAGEDHVDEDEWYRGASERLAELELEQEYFLELQEQSQVSTRDQEQQTDDESAFNKSLVNIRVTTDKAVNTTDIDERTNREPVKIVRVYKRSSLKPNQRLTSNNQKEKTKYNHKVKFEREKQLPIAPKMITVGRCLMECEDTARTIHRSSRKSSDSPQRITIGRHQQDFEDTGRSINRSSKKRSNSTEKRNYRNQSY